MPTFWKENILFWRPPMSTQTEYSTMSRPMTIDQAEQALHEAFPDSAICVKAELWRHSFVKNRKIEYTICVLHAKYQHMCNIVDLAAGVAEFLSRNGMGPSETSDAEVSAVSASIADLDAKLKGEMVTA